MTFLITATIIILLVLIKAVSTGIIHEGVSTDFACYQCATQEPDGGECYVADISPKHVFPCPPGKDYCSKKVVRQGGFMTVERACTEFPTELYIRMGCTYIDYDHNDQVIICICKYSQCNRGVQLSLSYQMILLVTVVVFTLV